MITTNYLIIGSGVAGLTFAIKIADRFPDKKVTIVTKSNADESNTKYAQGGIAIVTDETEDSYQKHIEDTLICGDGLCDVSRQNGRYRRSKTIERTHSMGSEI